VFFAAAVAPRQFVASRQTASVMNKLCIFAGTTVFSYAGWGLGEWLGLGFGWSFVLSGIGSIVGVYAGWKVAQHYK
jgi:hypothetical protein